MLIGLAIRDVVLAQTLDLTFGPGLTVLTGETGAGKSIILDALGLALGARGDAALIRRGAAQASASAVFALPNGHPAWALLEDKGVAFDTGEDLVLRRLLSADGRSRAFVNDQAIAVATLRELGEALVQVHGQHQTAGLLDTRTHRPLLDGFAGLDAEMARCAEAWAARRATAQRLADLEVAQVRDSQAREVLTESLAELDRLAPREGEEAALASERAVLAAAERAVAEISTAHEALDADAWGSRLGQAFRALARARERALAAGVAIEADAARRLEAAAQAIDRTMIEAAEAAQAIDAAADAFACEPQRLEEAEARLFALRAAARRLGIEVDQLPAARADMGARLAALEDAGGLLAEARRAETAAAQTYIEAAVSLSDARRAAAERLSRAVQAELAPLHLGKARFRVAVESLPAARFGPAGADQVEFEIATLAKAPFAPLAAIASGGELARFALAIEAVLAGAEGGPQPLMIFDEVDQGVGGAVADAVGQRLARLAEGAQVLVVTHSPQVAARADAHWRVVKARRGPGEASEVEVLGPPAREEEIARMLSGERVTEAARAAARALMAA